MSRFVSAVVGRLLCVEQLHLPAAKLLDLSDVFHQVESVLTSLHFCLDDVDILVVCESAVVHIVAPKSRIGRFFRYPRYIEFHPFFLIAYATQDPIGNFTFNVGLRSAVVLFLRLIEVPAIMVLAGCVCGMMVGQVQVNVVVVCLIVGMASVVAAVRTIAWAFWCHYRVVRAVVLREVACRLGQDVVGQDHSGSATGRV